RARRVTMVPVLVAMLFALLFPGGAQAMVQGLTQGSAVSGVTTNGLFELDADVAGKSPTRTDNTTAGLPDDWDRVCHTATAGAQCASATDDHASARSFDS